MSQIIGLSPEVIDQLSALFRSFSKIEKVILFGSRAMGNFKEYSDVDLAIVGNLPLEDIAHLKYVLEEETRIPYFFDVLSYESIVAEKLKEHVDTMGISIYQKSA